MFRDTTHHPAEDDPISVWISQRTNWPELSQLALNMLSIPASEVECERAFSLAKTFYTDERSRISEENLRTLVMVHSLHPTLQTFRDAHVKQETHEQPDDGINFAYKIGELCE